MASLSDENFLKDVYGQEEERRQQCLERSV
jgi:hypothetical protein